jgi:hypothetical protein
VVSFFGGEHKQPTPSLLNQKLKKKKTFKAMKNVMLLESQPSSIYVKLWLSDISRVES